MLGIFIDDVVPVSIACLIDQHLTSSIKVWETEQINECEGTVLILYNCLKTYKQLTIIIYLQIIMSDHTAVVAKERTYH